MKLTRVPTGLRIPVRRLKEPHRRVPHEGHKREGLSACFPQSQHLSPSLPRNPLRLRRHALMASTEHSTAATRSPHFLSKDDIFFSLRRLLFSLSSLLSALLPPLQRDGRGEGGATAAGFDAGMGEGRADSAGGLHRLRPHREGQVPLQRPRVRPVLAPPTGGPFPRRGFRQRGGGSSGKGPVFALFSHSFGRPLHDLL